MRGSTPRSSPSNGVEILVSRYAVFVFDDPSVPRDGAGRSRRSTAAHPGDAAPGIPSKWPGSADTPSFSEKSVSSATGRTSSYPGWLFLSAASRR